MFVPLGCCGFCVCCSELCGKFRLCCSRGMSVLSVWVTGGSPETWAALRRSVANASVVWPWGLCVRVAIRPGSMRFARVAPSSQIARHVHKLPDVCVFDQFWEVGAHRHFVEEAQTQTKSNSRVDHRVPSMNVWACCRNTFVVQSEQRRRVFFKFDSVMLMIVSLDNVV